MFADIDGMFDSSTSNADLTPDSLKTLETLVHAMWILQQKQHGFTNEMLDEALTEAMEIEADGRSALKGMVCPGCGRKAQYSGAFKIKCIYCGMEAVLNPYEAAELAREMDAKVAQDEALKAQQEKWQNAVTNDPYQPYDVSKDLNFDDFDDNNDSVL